MPTGYDLIEYSHEFRVYLLKRLAAALIDSIILFVPILLLVSIFNLEPNEIYTGIFSGFCWFVYSAVVESKTGTSLGKRALGLIVVSVDGPMTFNKGVIRNIPKMFWYIFLPFDFFVGLGSSDDPRKRWVDRVVNTVIIKNKK